VRSWACLTGRSPAAADVGPMTSPVDIARLRNIDRFPARTSKESVMSISTSRTANPPWQPARSSPSPAFLGIIAARECHGPGSGRGSAPRIVRSDRIWAGECLDSRRKRLAAREQAAGEQRGHGHDEGDQPSGAGAPVPGLTPVCVWDRRAPGRGRENRGSAASRAAAVSPRGRAGIRPGRAARAGL
jgi:hypothetical protein